MFLHFLWFPDWQVYHKLLQAHQQSQTGTKSDGRKTLEELLQYHREETERLRQVQEQRTLKKQHEEL